MDRDNPVLDSNYISFLNCNIWEVIMAKMSIEELVEIEKQLRIDHPELDEASIEIVLILVLAGCKENKPKETEDGHQQSSNADTVSRVSPESTD